MNTESCSGFCTAASIILSYSVFQGSFSKPALLTTAQAMDLVDPALSAAAAQAGRHVCRPVLVSDIVRACSLERAASAVDAALHAIIQMCASAELQTLLLQQGALGYLIPLLLGYDSTLRDESSGEEAASAQLLAAEGTQGTQLGVAAYLALSMQRTNMQVPASRGRCCGPPTSLLMHLGLHCCHPRLNLDAASLDACS